MNGPEVLVCPPCVYRFLGDLTIFSENGVEEKEDEYVFDMRKSCLLTVAQVNTPKGPQIATIAMKGSECPHIAFAGRMHVKKDKLVSLSTIANPDMLTNARQQISGIQIAKMGPRR